MLFKKSGILVGVLFNFCFLVPTFLYASWSATSSLPQQTGEHTSMVYNGYVYAIGGAGNGSAQKTVYYASINGDGTVGTWSTTTALPEGRYYHASAFYNGYVYVLGGCNGSGYPTTVYYASINGDGTLGTWNTDAQSLPSSPNGLYMLSAVAYNGYIYIIGGANNGAAAQKTIYYALLNGNGSIGTWHSTASLPSGVFMHTSAVYNGYVYAIGGYNGGWQSAVYYAPLNGDGTVGTWNTTTSLPTATGKHASVAYSSYVYIVGGQTSGGITNNVYYAPLNGDGTVGSWTSFSSLPLIRALLSSVVYNGCMYVIGGIDNSGLGTTTVYYNCQLPAKPSISGQPVPDTACSGTNSSTFTVTASNATSYQWQRGISGVYTNITGATTPNDGCTYSNYNTATLTITNAPVGMNGYTYQCIVTNISGSVTSSAAALTVNSAPSINTQPSSQSLSAVDTVIFTVSAAGATSYQWQRGIAAVYTNITGASTPNDSCTYSGYNTNTLIITNVVASMNNYTYRCVVTNNCGPVPSNPATLGVNTTLPLSPYIYARKSGGDVYIWWHPVIKDTLNNAKILGHYNVYRGTTADFISGTGNIIGAPTDTTFTNTGALSTTDSYYYLVKAVDIFSNMSKNSNMGFKLRKHLQENTNTTDKNWVSLPYNSEYAKATDMVTDIPTSYNLTRLRPDQKYESWSYNQSGGFWYGTNFKILQTEAYELSVNSDTVGLLVGSHNPSLIDTLISNLSNTDKNWTSIPYDATYPDVSTLVSVIPHSYEVVRLRPDQKYESWSYNQSGGFWYGTNFSINQGEGYEVSVDTASYWKPAIYANGSKSGSKAGINMNKKVNKGNKPANSGIKTSGRVENKGKSNLQGI